MLLTALTLVPLLLTPITALQTIYIGNKQADCGSGSIKGGQYAVWFSDSNVCNDGVFTGYPEYGTLLCGSSYTVLGHQYITFTGCQTNSMTGRYPTGVSDNGAPALTCRKVGTGGDDGPQGTAKQYCPSTCSRPEVQYPPFEVTPLYYCS